LRSNWQPSTFGVSPFGNIKPIRQLLNLAVLSVLYPPALLANPEVGQVIHGQVSIDTATEGVTTITNSPNAIIHWQDFSIAENEITRFVQENGQSAVLNRIIGENPSTILGELASNGKVFLINPNGIVFGAGATVDTQGLLASSLNLSDQDFLSGNYHFSAGSTAGNIVNEGIIHAGKDGNILLIAPSITNNGIIKSEGGKITLAAGQELTITDLDNPSIRFQITAPNNSVVNIGKLLTEGGAVNVFANSIYHSGEINADSVKVDSKGNVVLVAEQDITLAAGSKISANNSQGDAGNVQVESKTGTTIAAGNISAESQAYGQGGKISLLGEQVGVVGSARVNASGDNGGGQILVGGDQQGKNSAIHNAKATFLSTSGELKADAKSSGNGGKIIVWADKTTRAYGSISAKGGQFGGNGGFVETSGAWLDTSGIQVNAAANHGLNGQWLFDTNNIAIQAGNNDLVKNTPDWTTEDNNSVVTSTSIENALNNGTSVSITSGSAGSNNQVGDITVNSAINKSAGGDASLSLFAQNNIVINAAIKSSFGKLNLDLSPSGSGKTFIKSLLDLNFGSLTLNGDSNLSAIATIANASINLPSLSNAVFDGILKNINGIQLDSNSALTINHSNNHFNGRINNHGTLTINNNFTIDELGNYGGIINGSGNLTVSNLFDFYSGTLAGSGLFTTATGSSTHLAVSDTAFLDKNWNNYGTIYWQNLSDVSVNSSNNVVFNNQQGGALNISGVTSRHLSMAVFNNRGNVNLTDGVLKIDGAGTDTGSYQASGNGTLTFQNNTRNFFGTALNSQNQVNFVNGNYTFFGGSIYNATNTVINDAKVTFSTGTDINLPNLTLFQSTLSGADTISVSDTFILHSGELRGIRDLITTNTATTTLADLGDVVLNRSWHNFGTINWINGNSIDSGVGSLNNEITGVINISANNVPTPRLAAYGFNNDGLVNLTDGTLQIYSLGNDTGSYSVSGTGHLQFIDGDRNFNNGAVINSTSAIDFINDGVFFRNGSQLNTQHLLIDGGNVRINTGSNVALASLTLTNNAQLQSSDFIEITDNFTFDSGIFTGAGKLATQNTSHTFLNDGNALVNKNWDNYGTVDFSGSSPLARLVAGIDPTQFQVRTWNNYGLLNWFGDVTAANPLGKLVILTNQSTGIFNISNTTSEYRELSLAAFNNAGTVNLSSGGLTIASDGANTGTYNVTGNGQLQFAEGSRSFNSGSHITSANAVNFSDGINNFNRGADYDAPETIIDGAIVNFNTNMNLAELTMNDGILNSNGNLQVNGAFTWSGGNLTGPGQFDFNNGFNYSDGLMLATGTINIKDFSSDLLLPAMPAITRLNAQTTGNLHLLGDINASGNGSAIQLSSLQAFDNLSDAQLTAANGRWLIYANNPSSSDLGILSTDFKHYGCAALAGNCNDGFNIANATGNGVLYDIIPLLTVTPNNITSTYGNKVNFTTNYTGFIDGDNLQSAGISGNAVYGISGSISGAGYHNARLHDVSYLSGLANKLGYKIIDNSASINEWAITPRNLGITANPSEKLVGATDPALTYQSNGLLAGDDISGGLTRNTGEDAGIYDILLGSVSAGSNYLIDYTGANFKINAETDVPTAPVQTYIAVQQNDQQVLSQQLLLNGEIDGTKSTANDQGGNSSSSLPEKTKPRALKQCQ